MVAGLAGSASFAWVQLLLYPQLLGFQIWDLKFVAIVGPALLMGLLFGFAAILFAKQLKQDEEALAFWAGAAASLAALVGSWLTEWVSVEVFDEFVPILGLVFVSLAVFAVKLPAPSRWVTRPLGGGNLILFVVLLAGVSSYESAGFQYYNLSDRPVLPQLDASGPQTKEKPDVLLISVDTLRADSILREDVPTPTLDALRESGAWAEYGLAPAPATLPSHVSMLSGTSILSHATYSNEGVLPNRFPTLAEVYRHAGYRTIGTVSNGVLRKETDVGRGFEIFENVTAESPLNHAVKQLMWSGNAMTWLGRLGRGKLFRAAYFALIQRRIAQQEGGDDSQENNGGVARDLALAYLDDLYADERPFFYFLHFMDPHQPYTPPASTAGKLSDFQDLPDCYRAMDKGSLLLARQVAADIELGVDDAKDASKYLHDVYHEELMFIDDCLAEVFSRVRESGRSTLILFTSDHGEQFGEHSLMLHNNSVYEPLLRVPFILAGHGVSPGKRQTVPHLEDISTTLLVASGLTPAPTMEGRDWRKLEQPYRVYIGANDQSVALYQDGWKMISDWVAGPEQESSLRPKQLFHLQKDPAEEQNQLDDPNQAKRVASMLALLRTRVAEGSVGETAEMSAEDRQMLDELGY